MLVEEGAQIKKGQVLLTVNTGKEDSYGEAYKKISSEITDRIESLESSLLKSQLQLSVTENNYRRDKSSLQQNLSILKQQISYQISINLLAQKNSDRYESLYKNSYVTAEEYEQKSNILLSKKADMEVLNRQYHEVELKIAELDANYQKERFAQEAQSSDISRKISQANQELIERIASEALQITTSVSGTVSLVNISEGQYVDSTRLLMAIIPSGSTVAVELYANSSVIGFIKVGQKVQIRYSSYPYQKYGVQSGVVTSVSTSAESISQLAPGLQFSNSKEEMYKIKVKPISQNLSYEGAIYQLQAGMTLEADIFQSERKIYEWFFEPLFSIQRQ
jgi:membrane fusion protein